MQRKIIKWLEELIERKARDRREIERLLDSVTDAMDSEAYIRIEEEELEIEQTILKLEEKIK